MNLSQFEIFENIVQSMLALFQQPRSEAQGANNSFL